MSNIKTMLDNLTKDQRDYLFYAFEQELGRYIELPDKRFIAVNAAELPNLIIEQTQGYWSVGKIKES